MTPLKTFKKEIRFTIEIDCKGEHVNQIKGFCNRPIDYLGKTISKDIKAISLSLLCQVKTSNTKSKIKTLGGLF